MTMNNRCPGQDFRNLSAQVHKCSDCGAEVEIFSNEPKVRCHNCDSMVYNFDLPSCVEWCASARECMGEERWKLLGR